MSKDIELKEPGHLKYLSLGAGVQSTCLALMMHQGEIEAPDVAIFADTGWEPTAVYEHLDWLISVVSFPVIKVSAGNLRDEVLGLTADKKSYLRIPAYTRDPNGDLGILRRQCTQDYKITPVEREARRILGAGYRQRLPANARATVYIGISADEAQRAKPNRAKWATNEYPLLELRMQRAHCLKWMRDNGYPEAPRSACLGCPFHSNAEWRHIQRTDPVGFADAVEVDRLIRDSTQQGIKQPAYLHDSCIPLSEVDFSDAEDAGQLSIWDKWGNECEGMCGV
jgi:hypothetical protein